MRLAVLLSGEGTNLDALVKAKLPIALVVADRTCKGLHKARHQHRMRGELVARAEPFDRFAYTTRLLRVLAMYGIELVVMAGFRTILAGPFFVQYRDRALNVHPSRLPLFRGNHAVRDTLACRPPPAFSGSTVHVAIEELDCGRILAQSRVPVYRNDTEFALSQRLKRAEHELLPHAVKAYIAELEAFQAWAAAR